MENHAELRKRSSKFAGVQKVLRIPRSPVKFKLRAGKRFKQQKAAGPERSLQFWKQRSLQILNAQNQLECVFGKLKLLEVRLHQVDSAMMTLDDLLCTVDAASRNPLRTRSRFEHFKPCAGPIHRGDVLAARTQEERMPPRAARHVQCWSARQQRQKFSHDARRLSGLRRSRKPVLFIPIGLARRHKKAPERKAQEPRNSLQAYLAIRLPRLDAKGTPATAGALHVGVVELEPRTFDGFDVIDLNAFEIHGTHLVHRDLQTVKLENLVRIRGLVLKRHVVLETRAAAADYCHAQRDGHRCLHVHDFLDLSTCNGRQIDHSFLWPPLTVVPAMLATQTV